MNPKVFPQLATLLDRYFKIEEFILLADLYKVNFEYPLEAETSERWLRVARELLERLEQGNHRVFLDMLVEQLEIRNTQAIASTGWEKRAVHEGLSPVIAAVRETLEKEPAPNEIAVTAQKPFTAKSQVRELLEQATTDILIVDPYIGVATLDCLRLVTTPIRILTGVAANSVESGFDAPLAEFRKEGFNIEVRRAAMLHDRHLVFNDRCWLVGSSLKDAGKKAFNSMEIVDTKATVIADLEAKWSTGTLYPP